MKVINSTDITIAILESMNQEQLLELFSEIQPLAQLALIASCAVQCYETELFSDEESELNDWRNQDNDERARDIRISNERPY